MTTPLLCATITAETTRELRRLRDEAAETGGADLLELRLDAVADPDVAGALAGRTKPVVVTCRAAWEGGGFRGSEEERKRILTSALDLGAEYVDIEWRAGFDDLVARQSRIVLSMHDFDGMPGDLTSRYRAMCATGAQVVKLAVTPKRLGDCVTLRCLGTPADHASHEHPPHVLLGMGDYGLVTRILPSRFGSAWTYAGRVRGVGQLSLESMLNDYRFRALGPNARLYGIVGGSVAHSVSPAMHNAAFGALGIDAVYVPFPAASADDFMTFAKGIGISGASVTIPYKVALFDRLDEVYPGARRVGAINTIHVENGRWLGDNTDTTGFLQPLRDRVALDGLRASVLGAGGAARAVANALSSSRCTVRVHARQREQAEEVATLTGAEVGAWPPAPRSWDLLINCTPIGQFPRIDETPVPRSHLTGRYVYDLVYNPTATRLLRDAAEMGCQTVSGIEMLVAQAHEQFRWWTGARAPDGVMRDAALTRLAEFAHDENHVV